MIKTPHTLFRDIPLLAGHCFSAKNTANSRASSVRTHARTRLPYHDNRLLYKYTRIRFWNFTDTYLSSSLRHLKLDIPHLSLFTIM